MGPAAYLSRAGNLSLLLAGLLLPASALADNRSLDLSRRGYVCDRERSICYDRRGPSPEATRAEFGSKAERALIQSLSGKPRMETIRFSTGAECDLREQICWDDGRKRRNVSQQLNKQLFGNSAGGSGSSGWRPSPAEVDLASCRLSQRNRRLFDGRCDLVQRPGVGGTAYVVDLRNGRRYSFYNRMGRLVMSDATGTWPVQTEQRGNRTVFRWADLELETYRQEGSGNSYGRPPYGSSPGSRPPYGYGSGGASGLQQMIEGLFR